jgi:molybdopterin converting factor small subunit
LEQIGMIAISVRLNGQLATTIGAPRLQITLPDHASVAHLVAALAEQFPQAAPLVARAVPVVEGRHVSAATPLSGTSEVALLLPIAGG